MIKKLPIIIFIAILLTGFGMRLYGISTNHSFWSDEAYIAAMARSIIAGEKGLIEAVRVQDYQPLHLLFVTASMALFGISEWSARIGTVVMGSIGIIFAYLLAAKISTREGGLLAAFLFAFSQLNLSNSTQAKQYAAIQTLLLAIFYLFHVLVTLENKNKKKYFVIHAIIIALCTISTLLHFIGIVSWVSYLAFILVEYRKAIIKNLTIKNVFIAVVTAIILGLILKIPLIIKIFLGSSIKETFFTYNHLTYFRELFWRNYGFITLPAIFGILFVPKKFKSATYAVVVYTVILSYLWIFKHYTHNIRYAVPLFGILFVYFAVFWSRVGEDVFKGKVWITCLLVAIILYGGGYKFVRKPATYYSPNADFAADVQNANYKKAYVFLDNNFSNLSDYVVYTDFVQFHLYYSGGKAPDAIFMKPHTAGLKYGEKSVLPVTNTPIYTTLNQFLELKSKQPKGLLIVEDWESILPEVIKQYAKKNLKLEYRVESLEVSPTDKWPIEIYSWGMEEK